MTYALNNSICSRQAGPDNPAGAVPVFFGYYWWWRSPTAVESLLESPD